MVPDLLNLLSIYLICLSRVRSSSLLGILCICVAAGILPASSRASARLVQYLMLRASAYCFSTFHPDYTGQSPVVISISLTLHVTCGN